MAGQQRRETNACNGDLNCSSERMDAIHSPLRPSAWEKTRSRIRTLLNVEALILEGMDRFFQLPQGTRLDGISSLLEVHDCGPGNPRLTR